MKQLENELTLLRNNLIEMWNLVISQVSDAGEAVLSFDKELAAKVALREKKVDAFELKIDNDCENIIALHQPVAVDLRFVLAVLKINTNLERIADFAYGITRILTSNPDIILDAEVITQTKLAEMVRDVLEMLSQALVAFESEKTDFASPIFSEDNFVDEINANAARILAAYVQENPPRVYDCLQLISVYRKLERIGDHCSNIAEEIFFYIDAKVLKHSKKQ
jgi:phosphate transport system protein